LAEARYLRGLAAHLIGLDGEALGLIRSVADQGPPEARKDPAVWRNLAAVALATLDLDLAQDALERARALSPQGLDANALVLAGEIHMARGDRAQAEAAWRTALEGAPTHGPAWVRLTDARLLGADDLERMAKARTLAPKDRSLAHAWAHAQPAGSDARFAALMEANALARALQTPWDPERDRQRVLRALGHARASLAHPPRPPRAPKGAAPDGVVFITGVPRSGSTLLEGLLARHPAVRALGERPALAVTLHDDAGTLLPRPWTGAIDALPGRYLEAMARRHGAPWETDRRRPPWIIDKMLSNLDFLGQIHMLFPPAGPGPRGRILIMDRAPLDVALSCFEQNFKGLPWATDLADIGRFLALSEWTRDAWRTLLGEEAVQVVAYGDLVSDPDAVVAPLLTTLGLDPAQGADRAPVAGRTASKFQANQAVHRTSLGRAEAWADRLAPVLEARETHRRLLDGR
jgi:tetratricopeptide (TPR) repeat protein